MIDFMLQKLHASYVLYLAGFYSEAEAAARVSIENSVIVNYIYWPHEDTEKRAFQYMNTYFKIESERLRKWRNSFANAPDDEKSNLEKAALKRETYNESIDNIFKQAGISKDISDWPNNTFSIFEKTNQVNTYRTFYSRMSDSIHSSPEQMIRSFVSKVMDLEETFDEQDKLNSSFYVHQATYSFIRGCFAISTTFFEEDMTEYMSYPDTLIKLMEEIGEKIG